MSPAAKFTFVFPINRAASSSVADAVDISLSPRAIILPFVSRRIYLPASTLILLAVLAVLPISISYFCSEERSSVIGISIPMASHIPAAKLSALLEYMNDLSLGITILYLPISVPAICPLRAISGAL